MVDEAFTLRWPSVVRFGWGVRHELPALLQEFAGDPDRAFLVASRSALTGPGADLISGCGAARPCGLFQDVPHDPPLETIEEIVRHVRRTQAQALVALGGGSVIDAAKAAAALAPGDHAVTAVFRGEAFPTVPGLPVLALPTTAGSGAEVTANAVLTDSARGDKKSLRMPGMVPRAALVDPELTVSQPPELTAWSGLDALTQAIESFLSLRAHAASRPLAAAAVVRLMHNLLAAVRDGRSREARARVAEGSLLSGLAFSQSGLGAVHGLAHPLGVALGLPHGFICAVLLPHILRWNAPACTARLAELARGTDTAASADGFVAAVGALCRDLGVPSSLARHGLRPAHFPGILSRCRSASMQANPRPMDDGAVTDLLVALAAS